MQDEEITATTKLVQSNGETKAASLNIDGTANNSDLTPVTQNSKTVVVIVAYYRSGSSLTGSYFNANRDIMYLFEPLFNLNRGYHNVRNKEVARKIQRVLASLLDCELQNITGFRLAPQFLKQSRAVTKATNCSFVKYGKQTFKCDHASLKPRYLSFGNKQALRFNVTLNDLCKRHNTLVLKLIRGDIQDIEPFVGKTDPRVRVIHLVRDPRGILKSQRQIDGPFFGHRSRNHSVFKQAQELCYRMKRNLEEAERLNKANGNVVLTVRYEDVAANADKVVRKMFNFTGVEMTEDVRHLLAASAVKKTAELKERTYSTIRKNGTATALAWEHADPRFIFPIEMACKEFLVKAKYLK